MSRRLPPENLEPVPLDKLAPSGADGGDVPIYDPATGWAPGTLPPPGVTVQDEGVTVVEGATVVDFRGADLTATEGADGQAVIVVSTPPPPPRREVLMATGVSPPEPLETSDGYDWTYGEVTP